MISDPLIDLAPLRLPEPATWWPLAPGVWLLLAVTAALLIAVTWWCVRRYQQAAYRRWGQQQLAALHGQWQHDQDTQAYLLQANRVLKIVALRSADHADEVAALSGEAWQRWLTARAPRLQDPDPRWLDGLYRREAPPPDLPVDTLQRYFLCWVQDHA